MSSFTGVSIVTSSEVHTTPAIDTDPNSGYHLLVVKDYSRIIQAVPNGQAINSGIFMVGGHKWRIHCCPNGVDLSCADFISLYILLLQEDTEEAVEAKFYFSFVDEVEYQKPKYVRATETFSFNGTDLCDGSAEFIKRDDLERSAHLKADCFTIRCDIMVCNGLNTQDASGTLLDIGPHFDNLLQNKVGSDVTFEVSGERFAAYRCVLAARSKVFMAQLFGPMTEGITSSVIHIKDMEAKVFGALLKFIYTDSFPVMEEEGQDEEKAGEDEMPEVEEEEQEEEAAEHVTWLQDLFVAADRYDIQQLKFLCEKQLSENIGVSSVGSALALAEQHHSHGLKEACLKFIQVQSPKCLGEVMVTDGWKHITTTYPSVLNELIAKLVSNENDNKKHERM